MTYNNTLAEYAKMDSHMARAQMAIGMSSNLAQLAMTYYWTELVSEDRDEDKIKQLYDNFVILSVIAQVAIDGIKREYSVDAQEETNRISKMSCIENEKIKPDEKIIRYIADIIDVDYDYLVQDVYEQIENNLNQYKKQENFNDQIINEINDSGVKEENIA